MSCFTLRTKSPPGQLLVLEHLVEVLARRPGVGEGEEVGSGGRVSGRPAASSSAVQLARERARARSKRSRTWPDGNHGGGAGPGLRCS